MALHIDLQLVQLLLGWVPGIRIWLVPQSFWRPFSYNCSLVCTECFDIAEWAGQSTRVYVMWEYVTWNRMSIWMLLVMTMAQSQTLTLLQRTTHFCSMINYVLLITFSCYKLLPKASTLLQHFCLFVLPPSWCFMSKSSKFVVVTESGGRQHPCHIHMWKAKEPAAMWCMHKIDSQGDTT
jgi:hypothetical protein